MRKKNVAWWNERKDEYPYHAQAPTSVRPEWTDVEHVSACLRTGWRTWGFKSAAARDLFCAQFGAIKL